MLYGLIGHPLTHSFSQAYFEQKFASLNIEAAYKLFPLAHLNEYPALLRDNPGLRGLNVTIPYKEKILSYLDEVDAAAQTIGAVNCIDIREGRTTGYNTDAHAFRKTLEPLLQPHHTQALVLGTGGASKAVTHTLQELNIPYKLVSREKKEGVLTYTDLTGDIIKEHKLIINTTPLGLYPNTDSYPPLPYNKIGMQHLLYDLIYNPTETRFLSLGRAHGAKIKNGTEMLELQAEGSWEIWNR
ncbi:MAG: shikimate dehydrogenase [Bacteroidota bacterium]